MRELVLMGEIPALSLNKKHLVLLREDVLEFIRAQSRIQQTARRAAWDSARINSEFEEVRYVARKPGRKRNKLPALLDPAGDARAALRNGRTGKSRKRIG